MSECDSSERAWDCEYDIWVVKLTLRGGWRHLHIFIIILNSVRTTSYTYTISRAMCLGLKVNFSYCVIFLNDEQRPEPSSYIE